jgi:hypothetical protein
MYQMSPATAEAARKIERSILQTLAKRSQVKVAELLGTSESTVSRIDKGDIAAFLAACGLKAVSVERECFDPQYIKSLKVLAGVGLAAPEPMDLDWTDT